MTKLTDIFSLDLLNEMLEEGLVRKNTHPLYPELKIYVYTERATFSRTWNEVTNNCRGLITVTDEEGEWILARPFSKFHNLNTSYIPETLEENLPQEEPIFSNKLDGSLGIVYHYDNQVWVATKGSFDSEQSRWATMWLREHIRSSERLAGVFPKVEDATLVAEVVYAANRIVVDYGDYEGLTVLGLIENSTGDEYPRDYLEFVAKEAELPVVEKFTKTLAQAIAENTPNTEGYVVTFPKAKLKVKVKFEEYCRLHRIYTGTNVKDVWEMLRDGKSKEIKALLDDQKASNLFKEWLTATVSKLRLDFDKIYYEVCMTFASGLIGAHADYALKSFSTELSSVTTEEVQDYVEPTLLSDFNRKLLASRFARHPYSGAIFAMLDHKGPEAVIWDMLKPKAGVLNNEADSFRKDGE